MIEILPIKLLTDEDTPIFGSLNVALGKLSRLGLPVAPGIVVTPPNLILKTTLEHYDFGAKEIFRESLILMEKEINKIPVPEVLEDGVNLIHPWGGLRIHRNKFFVNGKQINSVKNLWFTLLGLWLDQIKERLMNRGFYNGITDNLDPQVVIFVKKIQGIGTAYFDSLQDDVEIRSKEGKLHPHDLKHLVEIVQTANKKLFIPHEYEWIVDDGIKLVGLRPYTPSVIVNKTKESVLLRSDLECSRSDLVKTRSAVKVFFDLSTGFIIEKEVDGVYIASEKIFDLNKPSDSFEQLVFRLIESATTFPTSPVLFKLADKSEGMGKIRGTLRLLHQKSLLDPLMEALDFARHKKGLINVHVVVPFVRTAREFLQIKRELAIRKLSRKNSLQLWMEVAVPENIVNLEDYLLVGLDGVVLNLDELISHLNGFDPTQEDLMFYKNEAEGLIKFLEDGIRFLHKSKVPFIAYGSLALFPKVLEFLVEKGVWGVVIERYEAHSAKDLLHQTEKRLILRRST